VKIEVVTLFPEMIREAVRHGILGRAVTRGLMSIGTEDPRAYATDVHRTVDDRPYGGGPGMVMKPEPLCQAIATARTRVPAGSRRVYLSAQGVRFDQSLAKTLAGEAGLVLVAGRYEGIDERVIATSIDLELSVGDYVLSGGELPALTVIDALVRLLEGALGDSRSSEEDAPPNSDLMFGIADMGRQAASLRGALASPPPAPPATVSCSTSSMVGRS